MVLPAKLAPPFIVTVQLAGAVESTPDTVPVAVLFPDIVFPAKSCTPVTVILNVFVDTNARPVIVVTLFAYDSTAPERSLFVPVGDSTL